MLISTENPTSPIFSKKVYADYFSLTFFPERYFQFCKILHWYTVYFLNHTTIDQKVILHAKISWKKRIKFFHMTLRFWENEVWNVINRLRIFIQIHVFCYFYSLNSKISLISYIKYYKKYTLDILYIFHIISIVLFCTF